VVEINGRQAAFSGYTCAEHNSRIDHDVSMASATAFATRVDSAHFGRGTFPHASLATRAQDPFILSLATAIDQSSLTPRERLGLRLFFDSNLSEPEGTACASCHDPRRAFTGNNNTLIGVAQGSGRTSSVSATRPR
jgi:cytochrome c peroxidase